jgi:hypothetical protein
MKKKKCALEKAMRDIDRWIRKIEAYQEAVKKRDSELKAKSDS